MALLDLKFDEEKIDGIRKFVKGCYCDETSEKLEKLPENVKFPEDLKNKIRYDKSNQRFTFKGIMAQEEKEKLLTLPTETLSDNSYEKAIEALFAKSNNGSKGGFTISTVFSPKKPSANATRCAVQIDRLFKEHGWGPFIEDKEKEETIRFLSSRLFNEKTGGFSGFPIPRGCEDFIKTCPLIQACRSQTMADA
jgi:hypothetical protein